MGLSDEGPTLKMLDYAIRIGSTPIFLYFNFLYLLLWIVAMVDMFCLTSISHQTKKIITIRIKLD